MKYCSHCKACIDDNEEICPYCGESLIENTHIDNSHQGTKLVGFIIGFFMGLPGLIVILILGYPLTTKGAIKGFLWRFFIILGFMLMTIAILLCAGDYSCILLI